MSTPEDHIAQQLRDELQARIGAWKAEREQLLQASVRIAELDALIAFAEDDSRPAFKVAPRPRPPAPVEPNAEPSVKVGVGSKVKAEKSEDKKK